MSGPHSQPTGWRRALVPPSRDALRYAAALVGPLAALVLGCKVHKLATVDAEVGVGGLLVGVGADVAFLVLYFALTAFALSVTRGWVRIVTGAALHAATLSMALLAVVEHGFYMTTGALLDFYLLGYGIEHFGALQKVYMSEMGATVWIGLGAVVMLNLLPLLLAWWRRRRSGRAPDQSDDATHLATWTRRPTSIYAGAGALLVALGFLLSALTLPSAAEPLRGNLFLGFAADGLADPVEEPLAPAGGAAPTELQLSDSGDGPRHNVVLIILESARARSTTPYAPEIDTMPTLARLAARGALVEDAYTVVPHTSKALVGILCGIYPKLDTPIEEAGPEGLPVPCLARILRDRGYDTSFFQPATAHFERRDQLVANAGYEDFYPAERLPSEGFEKNNYFGYEDDVMVQPILDWIDARGEAPFFLTALTLTSHHKYHVPEAWPRKAYAKKRTLDDYLNALAYTDRFLDKLFDGFEARGLLDDTIFVLIGDHGEGFGEHGRYQHDTVIYEEGLVVPFVVVAPEIAPRTRVEGPRQSIDISPTVLDLLGVEVTAGLPGRTLRDPTPHAKVFTSCWYRNRCMALRDGDKKVVYHFAKRPTQVFDLAKDPEERHDIAGAVGPERVAAWEQELLAWKAEANARYADQVARFRDDFVTTLPPRPARSMDVRLGDHLRIVGVDPGPTTIVEGEPLIATYHYEVLKPLGEQWRIFTHILGVSDEAKKRTNADHTPVNGRYPTDEWEAGQFVADLFRFQPRKPLPPGRYEVAIGLWNKEAKGDVEDTRAEASGSGAEIDDDRRVRVLSFEVLPSERARILP